MSNTTSNTPAANFSPVGAANGVAVQLAMQRLWLTGQVLAGRSAPDGAARIPVG